MRKALEYEDPLPRLAEDLIAKVGQIQESIAATQSWNKHYVSVVEVATMETDRYVYAIHVPEGKTAKAEFFVEQVSIDIPVGLSKLELVQTAAQPNTPPQDLEVEDCHEVTPVLEVRLNGKSVFQHSIEGFSLTQEPQIWKPDAKRVVVLDRENPNLDFNAFTLYERFEKLTGRVVPKKSRTIQFRLSADDEIEGNKN